MTSIYECEYFVINISGNCRPACKLSDLKITQYTSGKMVEGIPELKVTVTNDCACAQSDVKVHCAGFQTLEAIDPGLLRKDGDTCLLNNGQPLQGNQSFIFNYVWGTKYDFVPISSEIISCI